jgi:SAM-dependent methyltransferase
MKPGKNTKKAVKKVYAKMAKEGGRPLPAMGARLPAMGARVPAMGACCPRPSSSLVEKAKAIGYSEEEILSVPEEAATSLGCGNPLAFAELKEGEVVLDLGSGGGLDAFLAARKVGESGRVIGVDMTPEMVEKARANARKGGFANVEFRVGEIEKLPIGDASVDVIISNCVLNHCPDKLAAFREVLRVLKPGGRMLISDLVTAGTVPESVRRDLQGGWAEWLAAASPKRAYLSAIRQAGFRRVELLAERAFDHPGMDDRLRGKVISIQVKGYRQQGD